MTTTLLHGDCVEAMRAMEESSIGAVVCDPPYGLEFMGRDWDAPWKKGAGTGEHNARLNPQVWADGANRHPRPVYTGGTNPTCRNCGGTKNGNDRQSRRACRCDAPDFPDTNTPRMRAYQDWCEQWAREAFRVLKPGAYLLAFGGTRTYHRMACAIEDAGFVIKDSLHWLYGSGFPKSMAIDKALDKRRKDEDATARVAAWLRDRLAEAGKNRAEIDAHFGSANIGQYWFSPHRNAQVPAWDKWLWLKGWLGFGDDMDAEVWRLNGRKGQPGEAWHEREVLGKSDELFGRKSGIGNATEGHYTVGGTKAEAYDITAPATDLARRWDGYGTALKPAHEPIILAQKPLDGTYANNVARHGVGALDIDGCRVAATDKEAFPAGVVSESENVFGGGAGLYGNRPRPADSNPAGRWPPNAVFTHHPDCVPVGTRRVRGNGAHERHNTAEAHNRTPSMGHTAEDWQTRGHGDADGLETVAAWECVAGGMLTLPCYDLGNVSLSPRDDAASLLDRLPSLLQAIRGYSTADNSLLRGAAEFYCSGRRQSGDSSDGLAGAVGSALGLTGVLGSLADCPSCRRSCDGHVRAVLAACQAGVPSLVDALAAWHSSLMPPGYIPPNLSHAPLSSSDGAPPRSTVARTAESRSADAGHASSSLESPGRTGRTTPAAPSPSAPRDSSDGNNTASAGVRETWPHSACTSGALRLLVLLAADLSWRYLLPGSIIQRREIVINLPQCPVGELDRQSGVGKSKRSMRGNGIGDGYHGSDKPYDTERGYTDSGGSSRFFPTFAFEADDFAPFIYCAKSSRSERNRGLEGLPERETRAYEGGVIASAKTPNAPGGRRTGQNVHPTVKPLALMRWLVRLVTPPGETCLDPFLGSGTTAVACIAEGRDCIGIEQDSSYLEISRLRIAHAQQQATAAAARPVNLRLPSIPPANGSDDKASQGSLGHDFANTGED